MADLHEPFLYRVSKSHLPKLIRHLMETREVYGPVEKGDYFAFEKLSDQAEIRLDYRVTILPPVRKVLLPVEEPLIEFSLQDGKPAKPVLDVKSRAVVGVHPCDINGTWLLDAAFTEENIDSHYLARRRNLFIVGLNCNEPCDDHAFCLDMRSLEATAGFDLMLTELRECYLMVAGSPEGEAVVEGVTSVTRATHEELVELRGIEERKRGLFARKLSLRLEELPATLGQSYTHPLWDSLGDRCLSCAACNLVCPTCYCFDVEDVVDASCRNGVRERRWDSCQLECFTRVGSGEVFRAKRAARQRHRFLRKWKYLPEKFGKFGCVGCGRCERECLVDIWPTRVLNQLGGAL